MRRDLYEDRGMRTIGRRFVALVFLSLADPGAAPGYLLSGTLAGRR